MTGRPTRRWITLRRFDDRVRARVGAELLCGSDEVGRGPLAGPLVAAAVCLAPGAKLRGVDDSKVLEPGLRAQMAVKIREVARAIGWSVIGPREVDRLNIHRASLLAMRRALVRLSARVPISHVLIDGVHRVPELPWPQDAVVDGDARSLAVASASIVAKCLRDRFMVRLDAEFPHYGFARHKGYNTREHQQALIEHGPCWWHRFSLAAVRQPSLFAPAPAVDGTEVEGLEETIPAAGPTGIEALDVEGSLIAEAVASD